MARGGGAVAVGCGGVGSLPNQSSLDPLASNAPGRACRDLPFFLGLSCRFHSSPRDSRFASDRPVFFSRS